MIEALQERHTATADSIAELRRLRGVAVAEGRAFEQQDALDAAENALQGLADAEAVVAARQREQAAQQEASRRDRVRGDLIAAEEARMAALTRAEMAAREMARAFADVLSAATRADVAAGNLPVRDRIGKEQLRRCSQYLSGALVNVGGSQGWFGTMELRVEPYFKPQEAWADRERRATPWIVAIIKGDAK